MRRSITKKLFLEIVLVVLGFSALVLLSNTLLLRPLYYHSIRQTMISAIKELSKLDYSRDPSDWEDAVGAVNAGNAYDVTIGRDRQILYSSSVAMGLGPGPRGEDPRGDWPRKDTEAVPFTLRILDGDPVQGEILTGIWTEPMNQIRFMACVLALGDGTVIYLTQPIEPVEQSARQSNVLLIACAVLFLGVSAPLALRISKRFTRPIMRIRSKVGEITRLDFGGSCDIRTGDELEDLSRDVNRLSGTLETALRTLRAQNEQLEKDMVSQRKFMSNAGHELRTPLSLIKGYSDELQAGFVSDPAQQRLYMRIISEESAKMNRLLKEMLDLFRLESGRMELERRRASVSECVAAFLEKYHGFITGNSLFVSTDFGAGDEGFFDPMRFEQILANYVSNAAKYGGGDKRIVISSRTEGGSIRVSVFNSGPPIPPDTLPHIWDGFFKADEARTRRDGSYGLGLSVVKAIQTVAGQAFGAENAEGGVLFWFDVEKFRSGNAQ